MTAHNTSGNATSTSSGDNGNGGIAGHVGSNRDAISGGNETTAIQAGGTAQSLLTIDFNQEGSATATGGSPVNNGHATSNPVTTGTNTQTQTQTPSQTGTQGSPSVDQGNTSTQTGTLSNDAVNRARSLIDQSGGRTNTRDRNANPVRVEH